MPGFTHLQIAQPVTFGHHLLAYVEMLGRDRGRFADCRRRLNESPLGAAALAGTAFPIDREATAAALGFDRPAANSLDAVSDRDFAIEFLAAAALAGTHLSRFAEEIVLWASDAFGFIRLSDAFTTGSSIMPQKRNPDAAELVRAKTGRLNGSLVALLTVMKGLPLAYQKDMQEDKVPVFEAADALELCLAATAGHGARHAARPRAAARGRGARLQHRDRPRRLAGARAGPAVPPRPPRHRRDRQARRGARLRAGRPAARRDAGDRAGDHRSGVRHDRRSSVRSRAGQFWRHRARRGSAPPSAARGKGIFDDEAVDDPATPPLPRDLRRSMAVLALAACGKKGIPQPPPDEPNTYPRTYPSE